VFRDEAERIATIQCKKQKDGDLFKDAEFKLYAQDLDPDADGEMQQSLVAWHLGTDAEKSAARAEEAAAGRTGRNHTLLQLLDSCNTEDSLRKAFYLQLEGLDHEAKKKAYQRARAKAIDSGLMDIAAGQIIDKRPGR
jgi:hypothetical protein